MRATPFRWSNDDHIILVLDVVYSKPNCLVKWSVSHINNRVSVLHRFSPPALSTPRRSFTNRPTEIDGQTKSNKSFWAPHAPVHPCTMQRLGSASLVWHRQSHYVLPRLLNVVAVVSFSLRKMSFPMSKHEPKLTSIYRSFCIMAHFMLTHIISMSVRVYLAFGSTDYIRQHPKDMMRLRRWPTNTKTENSILHSTFRRREQFLVKWAWISNDDGKQCCRSINRNAVQQWFQGIYWPILATAENSTLIVEGSNCMPEIFSVIYERKMDFLAHFI